MADSARVGAHESMAWLKFRMIGTILNSACILIGGIAGLTVARQLSQKTQLNIKFFLGVLTVFVGLRMTMTSLGGGFGGVMKQLVIIVLALTLGRITGRFLRLQKTLNKAGQYANDRFTKVADNPSGATHRLSEGFMTCTLLFCVGPMAIIGSVQDGLDGQWQTLGIKGLMDGLATMAFVSTFGWGVMLSVIPVVAYQGTLSLVAKFMAPLLENQALLDSVNGTGGMLLFCVALIILDLRKIELGDYLPSLAFAPLLTWLLG